VICGFNDTRFMLNNRMRREAGFEGVLPTGAREKIICLKNYHVRGLFNGMFLELDNIGPSNKPHSFQAVVRDEEGRAVAGEDPDTHELNTLPLYDGHFLDHQRHDPKRHERDWKAKRWLIEATFGYAITCHKSQGSQWDNVIVWDDKLGQTRRDRAQWLYTAITRASEGLVIVD
jgi:exodeoxyribonuclease V